MVGFAELRRWPPTGYRLFQPPRTAESHFSQPLFARARYTQCYH